MINNINVLKCGSKNGSSDHVVHPECILFMGPNTSTFVFSDVCRYPSKIFTDDSVILIIFLLEYTSECNLIPPTKLNCMHLQKESPVYITSIQVAAHPLILISDRPKKALELVQSRHFVSKIFDLNCL